MGWLTGNKKTERKPVKCRPCQGRGWLPVMGMKPGGQLVQVNTKPCDNCNGHGEV